MPEAERLEAGDVLDGKYVIEGLIGRGGMGAVYRARHLRLDSPRAIKLMRAELAEDEAFVRRFQNEALLAEGVRHPNVVALYDFSSLPDGTKYIVWELVEGETLGDMLARGVSFDDEEVLRVIEGVADGLAAAHAQGIFHRDVSPDNIMICSDDECEGHAKVLDFGVAKAVGSPQSITTTLGTVFGKMGYASPEQMGLLEGPGSLDARTDIFSLAAVAYAMLTGKPPFVTSNMRSFLHDLMIAPENEVKKRFLTELDERWHRPLARALARNREERPSSMGELVTELKRAAQSPRRTPERRKAHLPATAASLLLGLAALMWALLPPEPPVDPEPPPPTSLPSKEPPRVAHPRFDPLEEIRVDLPDELLPFIGSPDTGLPPPVPPAHLWQEPEISVEPPPLSSDELAPDEAPLFDAFESEPPPPPSPPPPPRKIRHVEPLYPLIAKRAGIEGDVELLVEISETGDVHVLKVTQAVDPLLDRAAEEAVRQWKYAPTENGAVETKVVVSFELDP